MCHYPMKDSFSMSDLIDELAKRVWRDSFEWKSMRVLDEGSLRPAYCGEVTETSKDLAYMVGNEREEYEIAMYDIRSLPIVE